MRFQQSGCCVFGCTQFWQEDSIEHYSRCPISVQFARTKLNIKPECDNLGQLVTLGLKSCTRSRESVVVKAIWCYVLYRAHNLLRVIPLARNEAPVDILSQFVKEGVFGHLIATPILDATFMEDGLDGLPTVALGSVRDCDDWEPIFE